MKRIICALLLLLLLPAIAVAEVLAFEEAEYIVAPGKQVTLKPIAQGIDEKLTYKWKTEDKSIASTSKGVVTAKKSGTTTVTCTATTASGKEYIATATIIVTKPVKEIVIGEKKLVLPKGALHQIEYSVEPHDATITEVEWSSSNQAVVNVFQNGNILTTGPGTASITGKAKDGSGKKVTIKVTVPTVFVTDEEIIVTDPEGYIFGYQMNGTGFMTMGTSGTAFDTETVDDIENPFGAMCDMTWVKIVPWEAGTGKIWFNINGRQDSVKVTVKHSAVYDEVSCPPTTVKKLLASENPVSEKWLSLKGEVIKTIVENDYIEVFVKQGDGYFVFDTAREYEKRFPVGTIIVVYGQCVYITEYKTETGLVFECPVISEAQINFM